MRGEAVERGHVDVERDHAPAPWTSRRGAEAFCVKLGRQLECKPVMPGRDSRDALSFGPS